MTYTPPPPPQSVVEIAAVVSTKSYFFFKWVSSKLRGVGRESMKHASAENARNDAESSSALEIFITGAG